MSTPFHRAALAAFAVYLGGGVVLGETFPFSRFGMYSSAGGVARDQGAVPVFLADGEIAPVESFTGFNGLDPSDFRPPRHVPCTLEFRIQDIARWVSAHAGPEPGPRPGRARVRRAPAGGGRAHRARRRGGAGGHRAPDHAMTAGMRIALFLALVAAWIGTSGNVLGSGGIPHARGLAALVDLSWVRAPVGFGLLTVVYVAASGAAMARVRPLPSAGIAVVAMAIVASVDDGLYADGGQHHGKLLPIAVLAASTIGLRHGGELAAREAGAGVVAAAYTLAGLIKLWRTGPMWFAATNLPLLAAERAIGAPWPLDQARLALVDAPWVGATGGLAVLGVELAGIGFLWPPFRRWWAAVMIGCHASIGVFLGYPYPDWMLVLVAMGLMHPRADLPTWGRRRDRASSAPAASPPAPPPG